MQDTLLSILLKGEEFLKLELEQIEKSIAVLREQELTQGIAVLEVTRTRLQGDMHDLNQCIERCKERLVALPQAQTERNGYMEVHPGQYAGYKLSVAVQSLLAQSRTLPMPVIQVTEAVNRGGVTMSHKRSKDPELRGKTTPVMTRDVRLLAGNNPKRFYYNTADDTICFTADLPDNIKATRTQIRSRKTDT